MSAVCSTCNNWMASGVNSPMAAYEPPKNYPKGYLLGGVVSHATTDATDRKVVLPMMLTYYMLKHVVTLAHDKLVSGDWSVTVTRCFLSTNGINESYSSLLIRRAQNCKKYRDAWEDAAQEPEAYERLEADRRNHPKKYERAPFPSTWNRNLPLRIYVDTPMHLLFLGVARTVFELIGMWAKRSERSGEFIPLAMRELGYLEELKLQWLSFNVPTFDSWGGWVSEKFQSLCRVALWVYGPLVGLEDKPEFVEPTDRTVNNWLKEHYQKWLKVRGLSQKGDSKELKERVLSYLSLPEDQQPKVLPRAYGSADDVMEVLRSMVVMITTILQPSVSGEAHSRILALRVRLFLNAVERMHKPMRQNAKRVIKKKKQSTNKRKRGGRDERTRGRE
jgi:hypothetical protein